MLIEQFSDQKRFTPSEQQIIEYINQYPQIVVNLSLSELSEVCFVSQASIIRFAKKLGVKGFSEFKVKLAQELTAFALGD